MTNEIKITLDKYDLNDILYLLDIQRGYCVDGGAEYFPGHLYIPKKNKYSADLKGQISYYNGHVNMIDKLLTCVGGILKVDPIDNRHYMIIDGEEV